LLYGASISGEYLERRKGKVPNNDGGITKVATDEDIMYI
jgi:hypothetical protein